MRFHYLDNLRGLLMVLGIVLHTCAALSPSEYWIISYKLSATWADTINVGIHFFRMPLFFIISGFFTVYVFLNKGMWQSIQGRVQRILVPLISTLLTLNVLEQILVSYINNYNYVRLISISHLWFLVNLLSYLLILIAFFKLFHWLANISLIKSKFGHYLLIMLSPLIYIAVLSINYVVEILYTPVPIITSLYVLLKYLHFYILGAFIALNPGFLNKIIKACPLYVGLAFMTFVMVYQAEAQSLLSQDGTTLSKVLFEYLKCLNQILTCIALLGLSKLVFNKANGILKKIADASYTIYLFHHLLIIGLISLLNTLPFSLAPIFIFILVILAAYIITLCLHIYLVQKSAILLFLFNGKSKKIRN